MALGNYPEKLFGRHVVVVFEDGINHLSTKNGTLIKYDSSFLYLLEDNIRFSMIPIRRIYRVEVDISNG